jgi:hypothetical protein
MWILGQADGCITLVAIHFKALVCQYMSAAHLHTILKYKGFTCWEHNLIVANAIVQYASY